MAQWGSLDQANNSVLWGVTTYKQRANTVNRDAFFHNTTPDAYVTGITVGQYGITPDTEAGIHPACAHAGWVSYKVGSGGRSGRVQFETLVAMGTIIEP